jgi:hypothetical protein
VRNNRLELQLSGLERADICAERGERAPTGTVPALARLRVPDACARVVERWKIAKTEIILAKELIHVGGGGKQMSHSLWRARDESYLGDPAGRCRRPAPAPNLSAQRSASSPLITCLIASCSALALSLSASLTGITAPVGTEVRHRAIDGSLPLDALFLV